jgi:hypothetical protein
MLATFAIELGLAFYTLLRYKMDVLGRLIVVILALLALFQLAEYQVCGHGTGIPTASRVGFIAITMLPAIGIHIISLVSEKLRRVLVWPAYFSAIIFSVVFGLGKSSFAGHVCAGNYSVFQLAPKLGGIFFAYYYFWLILGILVMLYSSIDSSKKTRQALVYLVFGYLVLLIPTGIVNALNPQTIEGIPSIMCGFAIIYALAISFGVAPLKLKERKQSRDAG